MIYLQCRWALLGPLWEARGRLGTEELEGRGERAGGPMLVSQISH